MMVSMLASFRMALTFGPMPLDLEEIGVVEPPGRQVFLAAHPRKPAASRRDLDGTWATRSLTSQRQLPRPRPSPQSQPSPS